MCLKKIKLNLSSKMSKNYIGHSAKTKISIIRLSNRRLKKLKSRKLLIVFLVGLQMSDRK